ncbi:MAG: hypothetical protein PHU85_19950, partial [Phycisphaerae bacterium]|nr:hypothetical protein [Phycisphaerae bacterium]
GFRVGVGKAADFTQATQIMLAARDGKVRTGRMRFETDSPMEVTLDAVSRERRAFVFSAEGTASGDEFPACTTLYWVGAWHDVEHIDSVNLTLVPEIRFGRAKDRVFAAGVPRGEQYRDVGRIYNEVKLELSANRGEFVLIAPQLKGAAALVLGRTLLTDDTNKGQTREMVLLIRPRVVRSPGK